jgi:hypothetical protein
MKRFTGLMGLMTTTMLVMAMQWLPGTAAIAAPADARVKAALDKMGWKYDVDKDGDFKVRIKTQEGRSQSVNISSATRKIGNLEVRQIISAGYVSQGPLDAKIANQLLDNNAGLPMGAWSVVSVKDRSVALLVAKIDANSNADDLQMMLGMLTYGADSMEKTLTNEDKF